MIKSNIIKFEKMNHTQSLSGLTKPIGSIFGVYHCCNRSESFRNWVGKDYDKKFCHVHSYEIHKIVTLY